MFVGIKGKYNIANGYKSQHEISKFDNFTRVFFHSKVNFLTCFIRTIFGNQKLFSLKAYDQKLPLFNLNHK